MAAPPAPEPPTLLGYHRILSPTAGVRVSPLCLGTMSFGESWKDRMGECTKETSFAIMDAFYEAGGNFIDTANFYQNEESETWVGDWVSHRGNRDELVLATKYTIGYRGGGGERIKSNFAGNHSKSLRLSLQASLAKLKTDYVDILYVHLWDYTTSVEELMQSLHHVVMQGKVLYLGITAAPAWIVAKCNECKLPPGAPSSAQAWPAHVFRCPLPRLDSLQCLPGALVLRLPRHGTRDHPHV